MTFMIQTTAGGPVDLERIEYDPAYLPRESIDIDDTVPRYVETLLADPKFQFPPIVLVARPKNPPYMILDGAHRFIAYERAGRKMIPAVVEQLPESQWFARAVELNATHGRPMNRYDRTKIVRRLQKDGWVIEKIATFLKVRVEILKPYQADAKDLKPITAHPARRHGPQTRVPYRPSMVQTKTPPVAPAAPQEPPQPQSAILLADSLARVLESGEYVLNGALKLRLRKLTEILEAIVK